MSSDDFNSQNNPWEDGGSQGGQPDNGAEQPPYTGPVTPSGYGRYDNPYAPPQYSNPAYGYGRYDTGYGSQGPQPPVKKSRGLKVFLWVLGILAVGFTAAFVAFGLGSGAGKSGDFFAGLPTTSSSPSSSSSASSASAESSANESVVSGVEGNGADPNAKGITVESQPQSAELQAKDVYQKVIDSVVGVQAQITGSTQGTSGTSEGTGIIATSDGYILTNVHVIDYSTGNQVTVVLHDNTKYDAKVVGFDQTADLAVLKINATNLSPAEFGSIDEMEVGDQVVAIGNPGGLEFVGSLTVGYISALNRSIDEYSQSGMKYIQTDAAINPGNSGGPLVNMYGQVIGINSNKIVATGYEGMGFAIPVSLAKDTINSLMKGTGTSTSSGTSSSANRARLGISAATVPSNYQQYGYPQGVYIQTIDSDSDMTRAGAQVGDIIVAADGQNITSLDDLYAVLEKHKGGDSITMTLYSMQSGNTKTIQVTLLD